jgi:hypothetical protein
MLPSNPVLRISVIDMYTRSEREITLDGLDNLSDPLWIYKIINVLRKEVEALNSGRAYAKDGQIIYLKEK